MCLMECMMKKYKVKFRRKNLKNKENRKIKMKMMNSKDNKMIKNLHKSKIKVRKRENWDLFLILLIYQSGRRKIEFSLLIRCILLLEVMVS